MEQLKDYNVALISESDESKADFIDAFSHYLRRESLEDARKWSWSLRDRNDTLPAQYGFNVSNSLNCLCLYNAPVLDDTKVGNGNVQMILSYIEENRLFGDLHAILILINPKRFDESEALRRNIAELFLYLYNSSNDNILFCIHRPRGRENKVRHWSDGVPEFVRHMKSLIGTRIQLSDLKVFCFDNWWNEHRSYLLNFKDSTYYFTKTEDRRFEQKNGISVEASWKQSQDQAKEIIKEIIDNPPFRTRAYSRKNFPSSNQDEHLIEMDSAGTGPSRTPRTLSSVISAQQKKDNEIVSKLSEVDKKQDAHNVTVTTREGKCEKECNSEITEMKLMMKIMQESFVQMSRKLHKMHEEQEQLREEVHLRQDKKDGEILETAELSKQLRIVVEQFQALRNEDRKWQELERELEEKKQKDTMKPDEKTHGEEKDRIESLRVEANELAEKIRLNRQKMALEEGERKIRLREEIQYSSLLELNQKEARLDAMMEKAEDLLRKLQAGENASEQDSSYAVDSSHRPSSRQYYFEEYNLPRRREESLCSSFEDIEDSECSPDQH